MVIYIFIVCVLVFINENFVLISGGYIYCYKYVGVPGCYVPIYSECVLVYDDRASAVDEIKRCAQCLLQSLVDRVSAR